MLYEQRGISHMQMHGRVHRFKVQQKYLRQLLPPRRQVFRRIWKAILYL